MSSRFILLLFLAISFSGIGALNAQTITTTAATNVTDIKATLNGTANANGGSYSIYFEYGTTTSYGSNVDATPVFISGSNTVSASANPSGLLANTTYHFRLRTTTGVTGSDMTFTMGPPATAPTATARSATSITSTKATLGADTVFTGSSATTLAFEYGPTTSYGSQVNYPSVLDANKTYIYNVNSYLSANVTGLTPGITYHFRAKVTNNEGTGYSTDLTFATPMPVVVTTAATGVTDLAATLHGTANPAGDSLSISFDYGMTAAYGFNVGGNPSGIGGGTTPQSVTASPADLLPATTYHYRIRARSDSNVDYLGSDVTFTTAAPATLPTVTVGSATSITPTGATVAGLVFSGSSPTILTIDYGTTTAYGSQKNYASLLATNTTTSGNSVTLTGLTPSTTYHYRGRVTNNEGTGLSTDHTFTTLPAPTITSNTATGVTDLTATINGTANSNGGGTVSLAFEYGLTTGYGSTVTASPSSTSGSSTVSVSAVPSGLLPGTTYHYRLRGTEGGASYYGLDKILLMRPAATPPTVTTGAASPVYATSATLKAATLYSGSSPAVLAFEYGPTSTYGTSRNVTSVFALNTTSSSGLLSVSGLQPGTLYHFRAKITNNEGVAYGADSTFTTAALPVLVSNPPIGVSDLAATFNGSVDPGGGMLNCNFQYGTTTSYGSTATATPSAVSGTGPTAVSATPSGLQPGKAYHYRVTGTDAAGTSYFGNDVSFTTAAPATAPTVTTGMASPLGATVAMVYATGINSGSSNATVVFEYGTTTGYGSQVVYPTQFSANSTVSALSTNLLGLTPGTLYHYRAKAGNQEGVAYGSDATFTTLPVPTVTTGAPTGVTDTVATLNGSANANSTGSYTATFEYGVSTGYGSTMLANPSSVTGTGTTNLSAAPAGLLPATTYHYRLKLTDGSATFYGSDATFTMSAPATAPTATTAGATQISATTAYLQAANVISGSSPATISFLYGTTASYGLTASFLSQPTSHSYTSIGQAVTGLQPSTTYHFTVTAVNNEGSVTGNDLTFTTMDAATLATAAASSITDTVATLNGSVDPNGVSSTFSFEYGTSTSYGSRTTPAAVSGAALLPQTASLSGLQPLTTYHFRARLDNVDGVVYGNDLTFSTSAAAGAAASAGGNAFTPAATTAKITSQIVAGASTATVVFEYGLTSGYGMQVAYATSLPPGSVSVAQGVLTGLQPNTVYHCRVKVTNDEGVVYSTDSVFQTQAIPVVGTLAASNVTDISAVINGVVDPGGGSSTLETHFEYGPTLAYGTVTSSVMLSGYGAVPQSRSLTGMLPGTTYHYHFFAVDAGNLVYDGGDMTFTTGAAVSLPTVETNTVSPGAFSAILFVSNISAGASAATLSFEYGTDTTYGFTQVYAPLVAVGAAPSGLGMVVTGLTPNTVYHFRPKISNAQGTVYGADEVFTTLGVQYSATTKAATLVTATTAMLNGVFDQTTGISTVTFEYGTDTSYGASVTAVKNSTAASATLTDLFPSTTYHFRLVNANTNGTAYGDDMAFTTPADLAPIVSTGTASGSGNGVAVLRGTVNGNGLPTLVVFEYGLNTAYNFAMTTLPATVATNTNVPVSVTVSGLTANSTYFYRIVAMNAHGIAYGDSASVKVAPAPMAVTSAAQVSLFSPSVSLVGTANANATAGTLSYFEVGSTTDYGTTVIPLTPTVFPGGNRIISANLSSTSSPALQYGTTYHYRLVVYNACGYAYGDDVAFTTSEALSSVAYQPVTGLTSSSAVVNINVTEGGGTDTLLCDFGTTGGYGATLGMNPQVVSGPGVSPASAALTGLAPGTIYHYRVRRQRSVPGNTIISFSEDRTFTTLTLAEDWRRIHFGSTANSGDAADSANPSGDGINNLMKYALGLDPNVATSAVPQGVVKTYGPDQYLSFTFARDPAKTDVTYEAQVADSPAGPWTTIAISAGGAVTSGSGLVGESAGAGGTVNVEVHDTVAMSAAVRRFIRLQVTR